MTKKNLITFALFFVAVAAAYYYMYKDSFYHPSIQIFHAYRPTEATIGKDGLAAFDNDSILFGMDREFKLTKLKVVSVQEMETNKFAHPIWNMVSDSNSIPVKKFFYGSHIRGMHPVVQGANADPLLANVTYRLYLEAGSVRGQHDFVITDDSHLTQ